MNIETVKAKLIFEHYNLLKERNSWVNPDPDNAERMDAKILKLSRWINTIDDVYSHLGDTK